ncbi:MAG: serine/threonine-protein kinase [Polyangiaceae bacterium]
MAESSAPPALDGVTVARDVGSAGPSSSESDQLLQERLLIFVRLMFAIATWLYLVGLVMAEIFIPKLFVATLLHPARLVNAAAALGCGLLWLALRRRSLSLPVLRALDAAFALALVLTAHVAVVTVPLGYIGPLMAITVTLLALGLRAALVPSPPRRTALIALFSAVSLGLTTSYVASHGEALPYPLTPLAASVAATIWGLVITGATTATSRVVYGLQRQVQNALRLGQYTLTEKVGEGGMGAVYLARHAMLRRPTAIKLLPPDRAGAASLARFEREVQLTSQLTHPNTIAVYDYGRTTNGVFYYAMEYVDGVSLEELVRADGPLPPERVIHVLRQVAGALDEAHRVGLIHRDVKPANILLCERGGSFDVVKVVDFGLVKQLRGRRGRHGHPSGHRHRHAGLSGAGDDHEPGGDRRPRRSVRPWRRRLLPAGRRAGLRRRLGDGGLRAPPAHASGSALAPPRRRCRRSSSN